MERCFAHKPGKALCTILKGAKVPEDCSGCKFKKQDREVTNGKRYPFHNLGGGTYIPKYPCEETEMAIYKDTSDFMDWLAENVGKFSYEKVDTKSNTFMIRTKDYDGFYYTVWSRKDIRYKGSDRNQALAEFEKGRKRNE